MLTKLRPEILIGIVAGALFAASFVATWGILAAGVYR